MQFKKPKDDEKILWTSHVIEKMMYYGLSENKIRNVMWRPIRTEEGIAPQTIAVMQPYGSSKKHKEIWVMFQNFKHNGKSKKRIISAWRYPTKSKEGIKIYVPDDVQELLSKIKCLRTSSEKTEKNLDGRIKEKSTLSNK
jgi:hypothetical protein